MTLQSIPRIGPVGRVSRRRVVDGFADVPEVEEVDDVRALIRDELDRFGAAATAVQAAPVVAALHRRFDEIRSAEIDRIDQALFARDVVGDQVQQVLCQGGRLGGALQPARNCDQTEGTCHACFRRDWTRMLLTWIDDVKWFYLINP